jgi:hypothetical protein
MRCALVDTWVAICCVLQSSPRRRMRANLALSYAILIAAREPAELGERSIVDVRVRKAQISSGCLDKLDSLLSVLPYGSGSHARSG